MAIVRGKKKTAPSGPAEGGVNAFDAAVAAVRAACSDVDAWADLEEVGRETERTADVAALYREILSVDGAAALALGMRAVEFHDEWGEESSLTEGLVRRVLHVAPGETWAFDRLKLTFSTDERWTELLEVFDVALDAASTDEARAVLLEDAVKVAKDFARDFERAIGYAERLFSSRPDDVARAVLEKLYEKCDRHEALVALYREQLPTLDVPAAQALRKKIASKWLGLGDQDRAFAVIEEMLAIDAEDAGAFELLERIFGTPSRSIPPPGATRSGSLFPPRDEASPAGESPRSTRQRAALLLKPKYLAEGRSQELVRVLEVELAVARTDDERILAFRELAALHLDTLRDDGGALGALSSLVVLEPADAFHRKALSEVTRRLGRHDARAKVLVAAADRVNEPALRAALLMEAAEVCRTALGAPARAIDLYQRVSGIDALPVTDRLSTLRELVGLLGVENRLAEKCEALERIAAMETDPEARRVALGEVARIAQEDFGDADRSARAWQSRLADDPADLEAIDGIRPVLRGQGRLRDLASALERAASALVSTTDSEVVASRRSGAPLRDLLFEAATIAEEELHDATSAMRCFEELLTHAPSDAPVMERLAALYRQAERRSELLALRERQLALASDATERVRLRLDIADVHKRLGATDAQIAALEANLEDDPRHEQTASELGDALAIGQRFADLVSLWESLARAYEASGDRARATTLWREAAALAEQRLADPRRAIEDHERAGDDPASLDALARLYQAEGNLVASASALERLARATTGEGRIDVELRLASALVAAGRRAAARRALEKAAEEAPDARLRAMLADIYRADEDWERLAELFVREADGLGEDAEGEYERTSMRADKLRAAAELHLEKRADPSRAVPLLERAAALSDHATPIVLLLGPALVAVGRADDAVGVLRARVERFGARRPKERALVHLALARALSAAGEPRLALAELDVAVKIDPVNLRIRRALADAAAEAGELESAQRTYRALLLVLPRVASTSKPEITRAEVLLCLSSVAERLGNAGDASECEESALAAAKESEWERAALERELLARGRHARLAELLTARLDALDPEQAAAACDQLVRLYDDHLDRPEDAFAAALRAVSLTPASTARHTVALELGKRAGRPGAYLDVVREQSERAKGPEAAFELSALLGAAEEAADRLEDAARAFERAERAALELEPHDIGGRRLDLAWASLDRIYAKLGDDAARVPVLARRLGASEARGEPAAERAQGLYDLAAIELASPDSSDRGVGTLERALTAEPRPDIAESLLQKTLAREPRHERAAKAYVALTRAEGRERALVDALEKLGLVEADHASLREAANVALRIGDRATSEALLRRFIDLSEPGLDRARVGEALLELAALRHDAGDVRESAALKEQAAPRFASDRSRALLLEVAALAAGPLGDASRAARIYATLHREAPGDRSVWEPLLDIYRSRGDVEPLATLVEEVAPLLEDPAERARLRLEEATVLVRAAAVAPSRRPSAAPAGASTEVDDEWGSLAPPSPRGSGAPPRQSTPPRQSASPPRPSAAPPRASVRPSLPPRSTSSDIERAISTLWLVLDDDPESAEGTELLGSLLERGHRRSDLANLLSRRLLLELGRKNGPVIAALASKLGAVLEESGRDDDAVKAYRTALEWDADNRAVHRALLRLSEKRQEPEELAKATETLLLLEAGAEAERLALRLVSLLDAAGDTKGMRRALELGLERAPSSQALRDRLVELFEHSAEWQELAAFHIASAETRGTPEERVEALREAANVLRRELSDPMAAARALERAYALAPDDRNLLLSLVNAWSSAGEHARAVDVVNAAIALTPDDVSLLHVRAVLREAAGDLTAALEDRERVYALSDGDHGDALAALLQRIVAEGSAEPPAEADLRVRLSDLYASLDRVDESIHELEEVLRLDPSRTVVRAVLASRYGDAGRVDDAIASYALVLATEEGDELVRDTLVFADLCQSSERLDALLPALERARREAPDEPEIKRRLHATYAALGEKQTLATLLLEDAAEEADPGVKFKLLADAARLLADSEGGDPPRAIKVLADARALRPDDPEIGLLHADALRASGKGGEALDLLETLVTTQKRRTKLRGAMHRRIAQIYGGMGARMNALQSLVKAMDDDPHDAALAMDVGLQAVELNDLEAAARAFRTITLMKTVVEGSTEGASAHAKATAYYHLAKLADTQGDLRKARMLIEKAVSEAPAHEDAKSMREALKSR